MQRRNEIRPRALEMFLERMDLVGFDGGYPVDIGDSSHY